MSEYIRTCDLCGNEYDHPSRWPTADHGEAVMVNADNEAVEVHGVCGDCGDRYNNNPQLTECPVCICTVTESRLNSMPIEVDGSSIMCNRCVERFTFTCRDCDCLRHMDFLAFRVSGDPVCERCGENYIVCGDCGDRAHCDESEYLDDDDEYYCNDCFNNNHRYILPYDYTPYRLNFHGSTGRRMDNKATYFGCELEVEVCNGTRNEFAKRIIGEMGEDRVYIKSDGSLSHGIEIVTHPHTYEEICNLWRDNWTNRMRGLESHDTTTCGFHVHVSRQNLTPLHIQKIIVFINAPENLELVTKVAQRKDTRWAKIADKQIGHCGHSHDRYEAVNLSNSNTIEFRIFRGNTRTDRILKNIQFVHATVEFTRDRSYRDLSSKSFMEFVSANKREYKELHDFINESNPLD